ncbi:MAG: YdcF family protein [Rhodocyclaceae bacterium]|nr:YdcF family protein [Rhodocyclaceae bacterium]
MFLLKKLLVALILPPTGPLLLALFGLWLTRSKSRRWREGGLWLTALSLLGLLVLSLPVVGTALMAPLEPHPPIRPEQLQRVQAIVILGGGSYFAAPEYGGDTVSNATLERLRYGARLARDSGLPLLVTGGAPFGGRPEAESMREVLEQDFGVKVRWVEAASRDTAESASLSAPMLKAAGVTRIALISHGWHLPRAISLFGKQGLEVTPAPTAFSTSPPSPVAGFLPGALGNSRQALHEYLGQLYNRLKEH